MMSKTRIFLGLLAVFLLSVEGAQGQIRPTLSAVRDEFLLYEPAIFKLTITNITSQEIVLGGEGGSGQRWLEFLIKRAGRLKISEDLPREFAPQRIPAGGTISLEVDITPQYLIRDTGEYTIQGVVNVPGKGSFITSSLVFHVGNGYPIWEKTKIFDGVKRNFSLIKFVIRQDTFLYLRVEEPSQNLVFVTYRLGEFIAHTDPKVEFDDHSIHILHAIRAQTYRYTKADLKGKILERDNRFVSDTVPGFTRGADGVKVAGGISATEKVKRPKLSSFQKLLSAE